MDYKKIVAEEIQKLVSEHLTYDQVYQLLEVPKYTEHGDVAFPAFALAKAPLPGTTVTVSPPITPPESAPPVS